MATPEPVPADPWSSWQPQTASGDHQPAEVEAPGHAPLPDPPQGEDQQTSGPAPDQGSDSPEWHGRDWRQRSWTEHDENADWGAAHWGRQQSWSRREWNHRYPEDSHTWHRHSGDWTGTTGSTRDSDHGSDTQWPGRWSGTEAPRTTSTWTPDGAPTGTSNGDEWETRKAHISERMAVPSFSAEATGDDLGASARSYLRQIDAWIKVTRTPQHQQALLLYQHLQGRAWVESEELSVERLASDQGVTVFRQWVQERYQEVEVSKVAEALTHFFRKLRRGPQQSIREFNSSYDRAHTRLLEIDCRLPEVARAWAYLNGLGLSQSEELGILASVGNEYNTTRLQRAAILHEKSLKGHWQYRRGQTGDDTRRGGVYKNAKGAYVTEHNEDSDGEVNSTVGDELPEEEAAELHEAYMAQESAKAKYREIAKARGINPDLVKNDGKTPGEKLQIAKSRSFCSGCKRRGHWHRDPECPLNQGRGGVADRSENKDGSGATKEGYIVQIAYEVGDNGDRDGLYAITDCACSKTVAGQRWIQDYIGSAKRSGWEPQLIPCDDEFRFGASKLFKANYTATIVIHVEDKSFMVRAAVVSGDVPLLLSRGVLARLGMIYDIENHRADFKKLNITNHKLCYTASGHPAVPVSPVQRRGLEYPDPQAWGSREVIINSVPAPVYTAFMTGNREVSLEVPAPEPHQVLPATLFFPKKVDSAVYNMLSAEAFDPTAFSSWWSTTKHCNDFWIEGPAEWIRVHIIPRKNMFSPEHWRTTNLDHKVNLQCLSPHCGSEEQCLRKQPIAFPANPRLMSKAAGSKSPWQMTKAELIQCATDMGVTVHSTWTAPEIRSIIQERRQKNNTSTIPKGLSSMTLADLQAKATELNVTINSRMGKGEIMRAIRDFTRAPDEEVVTFGRFRNYMFKEVPESYLQWSIRETTANKGASDDLKRLAAWASTRETPTIEDPEDHAKIPYHPDAETSSVGGSLSSWSVADQRPLPPSGYAKAKAKAPGQGTKKAREETGTPAPMQQDLPPEIAEELRALAILAWPRCGTSTTWIPRPLRREDRDLDPISGRPDDEEIFFDCEPETPWESTVFETGEFLECYEDYSPGVCEWFIKKLCELAGHAPRRSCQTRGKLLVLGGYVHGGITGVTAKSHAFKEAARYLNSYIKHHLPGRGRWTSLCINVGNMAGPHRDSNNYRRSYNYTTSFGQKSGGRVWIERGEQEGLEGEPHALQLDQQEAIPGIFVNTNEKVIKFHPHRKHFVEAWTGERASLTGYAIRSVGSLTRDERDFLRSLGFPITDNLDNNDGNTAYVSDLDQGNCSDEHVKEEVTKRPRKSTRRKLWKSAATAGSLFALTLNAATAYACDFYPKPTTGVALQETGGEEETYKAAELGHDVAEPFGNDVWYSERTYKEFSENLQSLAPRVLWIHAEDHPVLKDRMKDAANAQLDRGGTVVYEASEGSPLWRDSDLLEIQAENYYKFDVIGDASYLWVKRSPFRDLPPVREIYAAEARSSEEPTAVGASAISFDKVVAPHVQAALTRLHQNLGHPAVTDLTRHLRLAGASEDIIKIAKGMRCQVCARNKRASAPRPASLPSFLDFNQLVSVDVFHVFDINRKRHEMLSVVDHGTTFHLVKRLEGHSAKSFEHAFVDIWANTFGAPGCIAADLETGLQAGLAKYCEFAGVKLRAAAGQAHWQQGTVERHGQWHQDILQKIIDEQSVGENDIDLAVTAANQAKNELRRRHGYSPCQAVFGKDPRHPEDLMDGNDEERAMEMMTADRRRQREVALRTAARTAFYRSQVDVKLRKGLIQRARVKKGSYAVGEMVCFYRLGKSGTTNKRGQWRGPGLILGNDGGNWWISYAGRCHLVAEEHMRPSTAEELGSLFSSQIARKDLETLLFADPDDPTNYATEEEEGDCEMEAGNPDEQNEPPFEHDLANDDAMAEPEVAPPRSNYGPEGRRRRQKSRPPGSEPYEALMMKTATTERSREKQREKELPWRLIPPEQHQAFKEAEAKQIKEHLDHAALSILTYEETVAVLKVTPPERILNSRWAYKDKNYAKRRENNTLPWKAKARLIIGGHKDPDVASLVTDAPTVNRLSVLILMQILSSHLDDPEPWCASAGDVNAAFLNGPPLQRTLFMRQPRTGIPGMERDALFKVEKGIFGLPDSPRGWWDEVQRIIDDIEMNHDKETYHLVPCALDPCVYYLVPGQDRRGTPRAYLCIHVDDLLVVGPRKLAVKLRETLSQHLPIEEWEENSFDYIGSHFEVKEDCVEVTQTAYAATRLFTVDVDKAHRDQEGATTEQKTDNQSLIGGLSWLAVQSRPDLQVSVSIAQQMQKDPSIEDVRFTNSTSRKAVSFKDNGLKFTKIDLSDPVLMVFHDSSWANVVPLEGEDGFRLSREDHEKGFMTEVPSDFQVRKAKRASTKVASQYGILILATDQEKLREGGLCNILDWKSSTAKRVCRSTFAAESIACSEGLEQGQYVRSVFMTILKGELQKVEDLEGKHLRCFTDCRSLYDHLHRVGVPRTPTDKRLAIDLAAIRQILHRERYAGKLPLDWIPTSYQLADVLTKPMCPKKWWNQVKGIYRIPFRST
ncbi:GIP [Symbiodinium sp. CCMP2592]|nr:GIP [Symbiodinium sp. CCMP2592]